LKHLAWTLDAELLISRALGFERIDLYLKFDQPLSEPEIEKCREFVRRRVSGEPLAYIFGSKDFFEDRFVVNKDVLIPRPETELIVEAVLDWTKENSTADLHLLDLGTGTGCIGLSLLKKLPSAKGILIDQSPKAIEVAKINCQNMNVQARCEFISSDVMTTDLGSLQFDIIVANPPYIGAGDLRLSDSVRKFEPHLALFSEDEGFACIKNWSSHVAKNLKSVSVMMFEFGEGQASRAAEHFLSFQIFHEVKIIKDLAGIDRHVLGMRKTQNG
jgi:release factor glutamine methyltransferase